MLTSVMLDGTAHQGLREGGLAALPEGTRHQAEVLVDMPLQLGAHPAVLG